MLTLKDLDNIDDGGLWEKLKKEIEAETNDPNQQLRMLTERVMVGFMKRLVEDHAAEKKNKMEIKKPFLDDNVMIRRQPRSARRIITRPNYSLQETKEEEEDNLVWKEACKNVANGTINSPAVEPKDGEESIKKRSGINKGIKRCLRTSGEGERKSKKQKTGKRRQIDPKKKLNALGLEPASDMPEEFKDVIQSLGGSQINLLMQKIIYATDLSSTHSRFSMPMSQFRTKFLSEVEDDNLKNGGVMNVTLVEPCLKVSQIHFTRWMLGSPVYIFRTEWNDVVKRNKDTLKEKAVVQVWSFRAGPESQLGFAIVKVKRWEMNHFQSDF